MQTLVSQYENIFDAKGLVVYPCCLDFIYILVSLTIDSNQQSTVEIKIRLLEKKVVSIKKHLCFVNLRLFAYLF